MGGGFLGPRRGRRRVRRRGRARKRVGAMPALFLLALLPALTHAVLDRPSYLCVNKGYGVPGPNAWLATDPASFTQASIDELLASFNHTLGSDTRRLCVSFNMWVLFGGAPAATYLASLNALLALVEANSLPLSISLDPTQWWQGRPDLYNWWDPAAPGYSPANTANVEWTGPSPANATAISWRNWGSQFRMPTPHPNYASPAFRAAAAEALLPLAGRLAQWYSGLPSARRWLLAAVRATQELWIGTNYYYYPGGNSLAPLPPAQDPTGGPGAALQLGYSAVCGGLGAAARAATPGCGSSDAQGQPQPLSTAQLDAVVSSFLSFSAGLLLQAGIPRSRLAVHTGSFFQAPPPCTPRTPAFPHACAAFNSPAAALVPEAAPGWSMYGEGTEAGGDAGVPTALAALQGAPWAAPEWNIFTGPQRAWAAALNGTLAFGNNRLLVVQNYESIAGDAGACAAVAAAVAAPPPPCFIDAPTQLAAQPQGSAGGVFALSWQQAQAGGAAGSSGAVASFEVRASTLSELLPSGQLAVPDVLAVTLPGGQLSAGLTLPPGFAADHVFWGVTARSCAGTAGANLMASDVALLLVGGQ